MKVWGDLNTKLSGRYCEVWKNGLGTYWIEVEGSESQGKGLIQLTTRDTTLLYTDTWKVIYFTSQFEAEDFIEKRRRWEEEEQVKLRKATERILVSRWCQ